jgi:CBS domain-containing protein
VGFIHRSILQEPDKNLHFNAMSAPTIVQAVISELQAFAPFSEIPAAALATFARSLTVHYYAAGEVIVAADTHVPTHVVIVKSGCVVGERAGLAGGSVPALELTPGEMFPIGAALTDRPPSSTFRAHTDALVYKIPTAQFKASLQALPVLQDFCERRLFNLLERSRAALRAAYAAESLTEHPFSRPLASVIKRTPVACDTTASIEQALRAMHEAKVGAIVVVDSENCAVGILTERDVLGRVVLARVELTENVMRVATQPVLTLDEGQTISAAALLMVSENIRHAVITRAGKLSGVLSERSLFALQRQSLASVSDSIASATDLPGLVRCAFDIRELSRTLVAQGVASGLLTQFISQLNDQLTQRVLQLVSAQHAIASHPDVRWAWIAFGSEGRHEQTISTDQDNGLIFEAQDVSGVRAALLAFAQEVNQVLAQCGYPLCKGNIMAGNPALCLSSSEWAERFQHWIEAGDPQSLLNANIFFDLRALYGVPSLVGGLQQKIFPWAKANARFRKQMADNALIHRPPLNWLGNIDASDAGTIDLKRLGAMPFTDGARLMALGQGVSATRTRDRLQAVGEALHIPSEEIRSWTEAFEFIQMLRLRHQHARLQAVEEGKVVGDNPNEIRVSALSALDQRILREAFRQARKLQQRIEMDYQ